MAQEIDIGGARYIASKVAATRTGYTQDYIGQLARGGHIEAKRVSGMWYILEESLLNYKAKADLYVPQPPPMPNAKKEDEVSVSFDGKDYVSAHRAASLTGYNQDYIGQLARSGHVLSRQVGNRWYVDRDSLLRHKKEKESLLAELQSRSVGIVRPSDTSQSETTASEVRAEEGLTHYNYLQEKASIPEIGKNETDLATENVFQRMEKIEDSSTETGVEAEPEPERTQDEEISIPIRVMNRNTPPQETYSEKVEFAFDDSGGDTEKSPKKQYIFAISAIVLLGTLGTIFYIVSATGKINVTDRFFGPKNVENASPMGFSEEIVSNTAKNTLSDLFSKELIYKR